MTYFGKPHVHRVMRLTGSPSNPKKVALFDLAFDPEPYLSMTAAELAEAMAAVPRAIPMVKLNAMPALFSLDDAGAPAQTDEIDEETVRDRIERIEGRADFLDRVSEALEIRNEYPESKHVEDQIYDGFPSWDDKKRMENFHRASSWATRYEIVKTLEDKRMRFFGARLILFNAPDVLPDQVRKAMLRGMINQRLMAEGDVPWTTCASARASLDAMEPSQDVTRIRAWLDDYEQDLRLQLLSAAA
jgi:exodeoxyribonuclease-1